MTAMSLSVGMSNLPRPSQQVSSAHRLLHLWTADHPDVFLDIFFHLPPVKQQALWALKPGIKRENAEKILASWRRFLAESLGEQSHSSLAKLIERHPDLAMAKAKMSLFHIIDLKKIDLTTLEAEVADAATECIVRIMEDQDLKMGIRRVARYQTQHLPPSTRIEQEGVDELAKDYRQMAQNIIKHALGPGGWACFRVDRFTPRHRRQVRARLYLLGKRLRDHLPESPCPSLEAFAHYYAPIVNGFLVHDFPDLPEDDRAECFQRVFERLLACGYGRLLGWDPKRSRRAYLRKIVRNVVRDYHREKAKTEMLPLDGLAKFIATDLEDEDSDALIDDELVKQISEVLIALLLERHLTFRRLLIVCGRVLELPSAEIARRLGGGASENSVNKEYSIIRRMIRERLHARGNPSTDPNL